MISKGSGHSHLPTQLFQGKTIFPSRSTLHKKKKKLLNFTGLEILHIPMKQSIKHPPGKKRAPVRKQINFISGYIYIQNIE